MTTDVQISMSECLEIMIRARADQSRAAEEFDRRTTNGERLNLLTGEYYLGKNEIRKLSELLAPTPSNSL